MVTQSDIAKELGVTRTTVARALNNTGPVNEQLKNDIIKLAKELGYKTDLNAKTLRMSKTIKYSVYLLNFYSQQFLNDLSNGIKAFEKKNHYKNTEINIHVLSGESIYEQSENMKKLILEEQPDGVIVIPASNEPFLSILKLCRKLNIKVGTLDMSYKSDLIDFHVGPDYYQAGRTAGSLMTKLTGGHGDLLLVTPSQNFYSLQDRCRGFKDGAKQKVGCVIEKKIDLGNEWPSIDKIIDESTSVNISGMYCTVEVDFLAKSLKEEEDYRSWKIIGNDINTDTDKLLSAGIIDAVINFRPFYQGYLAAEKMFKILISTNTNYKLYRTNFDIVIDENIKSITNK